MGLENFVNCGLQTRYQINDRLFSFWYTAARAELVPRAPSLDLLKEPGSRKIGQIHRCIDAPQSSRTRTLCEGSMTGHNLALVNSAVQGCGSKVLLP